MLQTPLLPANAAASALNWRKDSAATAPRPSARKLKKRDFRQLWIARINAATRAEGMSYSAFIAGLTKANVTINRKMLSEIAIRDPEGFKQIVEIAKKA